MAESLINNSSALAPVSEGTQAGPPKLAEPASEQPAVMSGALEDKAAQPNTTNGADTSVEHIANSTSVPSAQPATDQSSSTNHETSGVAPVSVEAAETQDGGDSAPIDDNAADVNGTPAAKRTPAKRKSTGGVPEHKGKKLNKKKSSAKITHLDAKPGDYYFARLKSYPPWPSIICDEDMLPSTLLNTRPVTTKKADGTYNEAYADGGKKTSERTFPVMFLYTNEFAWIPNTDLAPLEIADLKDSGPKNKTKALAAAYEVAAEGHDIRHFKEMLMEHANAIKEDEEAREAKAAEKAAQADKKKKRKSEVKKTDEDTEMVDADADGAVSAKKSSKKRKKEAGSDDDETEKPPKTPKTTKLKLTTKTPTTAEKKTKEPKSEKAKSSKKKKVTDDTAAVDEEKAEEPPLDPVEARQAREKEVLFLRHKLQKGFLSRDQAPREDEMPLMSNYIKKLEGYSALEVNIIRQTKINKVLKALVKLASIPRDEEFQFRKRSVELLGRWNQILGAEQPDVDSGDKDKPSPSTNGVHKEEEPEKSNEKATELVEAVEKVTDVPASTEAKASVIETLVKDAGEVKKADSAIVDRAPESAPAAHEIQSVVQSTE